jgi:hypothetical protein
VLCEHAASLSITRHATNAITRRTIIVVVELYERAAATALTLLRHACTSSRTQSQHTHANMPLAPLAARHHSPPTWRRDPRAARARRGRDRVDRTRLTCAHHEEGQDAGVMCVSASAMYAPTPRARAHTHTHANTHHSQVPSLVLTRISRSCLRDGQCHTALRTSRHVRSCAPHLTHHHIASAHVHATCSFCCSAIGARVVPTCART